MPAGNILVLCGGRSAERDVSCISAAAIIRNLPPRWKPLLVWIAPDGRWHRQGSPRAFADHPEPSAFPFERAPARLEPGRPFLASGRGRAPVAAVIPALHGPFGEDGSVQGLLELAGVPYVGCGVLGSSAGMDKVVTKRLAAGRGLPVLPYAVLESWERGPAGPSFLRKAGLRPPVFVKPARLGSSIGITKVSSAGRLAAAVRLALRFDTTVVVEQGVPAREIECAVLGGGARVEASVVGEIKPNAEFYSYEAKYLDPRGADLMVPARITKAQAEKVRAMSVEAFRAVGGHGLARVDFLMDRGTGRVWFNEINTFPGFTSISMYPRLWAASGVGFPGLIDRLIALALARHKERSRLSVSR